MLGLEKIQYSTKWNWLHWPLEKLFILLVTFFLCLIIAVPAGFVFGVLALKYPLSQNIHTLIKGASILTIIILGYGWFSDLKDGDKQVIAGFAIVIGLIWYVVNLNDNYKDAKNERDALKSELLKFEKDSIIEIKVAAYARDSITYDDDYDEQYQ